MIVILPVTRSSKMKFFLVCSLMNLMSTGRSTSVKSIERNTFDLGKRRDAGTACGSGRGAGADSLGASTAGTLSAAGAVAAAGTLSAAPAGAAAGTLPDDGLPAGAEESAAAKYAVVGRKTLSPGLTRSISRIFGLIERIASKYLGISESATPR